MMKKTVINQARMKEVLGQYKEEFDFQHWKNESYKWKAVKCFQVNWDIDAEDFSSMLSRALGATFNLLSSRNNFPRAMIEGFAKNAPEVVRDMFRDLYDENRDIYDRIRDFKNRSGELLKEYGEGAAQHYQFENAITTYLWLRYPDRYYIYKYGEVKATALELESDIVFKKGAYGDNIHGFMTLYDAIADELNSDGEIRKILDSFLTDDCYPDPKLRTVVTDFGFFINRYMEKDNPELEESEDAFDENDPSLLSDDWFPSAEEYTPGITKDQWLDLLNNKKIVGPVWGGVLAAFYENDGVATCSQIAEKYNRTPSSISGNCTQLAKRVHKETNCPLSVRENGKNRYWPILFIGKNAGTDIPGSFIWKLRPELYEALKDYDIMRYRWDESEDASAEIVDPESFNIVGTPHKRWIYPVILALRALGGTAPRPDVHNWIFETYYAGDEEELQRYGIDKLKKEIDFARNSLNYEGFLDDTAPRGIWQLNSLGEKIVISDKLAGMIIGKWNKIKAADRDGKPRPIIDLTPFYEFLEEKVSTCDPYSEEEFLNEVFMTREAFESLISLLRHKKNIILQGAPGVGKTFSGKRLAYAMMGEIDDSRIGFVQFHQNYSYEDFVMGYKPDDAGFSLKEGVFYHFCQKALRQPEKDFFFIIDEINRGNLSKIFGELLMLIEADYRGQAATLAYGGELTVPENLYIIGLMNTADRSLALIDYALRRRFSFYEMNPGFQTEGFKSMQKKFGSDMFDRLVSKIQDLNRAICEDDSLGPGFQIGHSYFCRHEECTEQWLREIVRYDLLPTLREYWFDDKKSLEKWSGILEGVVNNE